MPNQLKVRFQILMLGLKIFFCQFFRSISYGSIVVCGDTEFQKISAEALDMLKEKAADALDLVEKNIGFIYQYKSSGIFSSIMPSICTIKKESIIRSPTYYSGILCHEAYHVFLYHSFKNSNPLIKEVPPEVYSGAEAEAKCVKYSRQIMEKLGVDINTLPPIQELIDSKWWQVPWDKQNW